VHNVYVAASTPPAFHPFLFTPINWTPFNYQPVASLIFCHQPLFPSKKRKTKQKEVPWTPVSISQWHWHSAFFTEQEFNGLDVKSCCMLSYDGDVSYYMCILKYTCMTTHICQPHPSTPHPSSGHSLSTKMLSEYSWILELCTCFDHACNFIGRLFIFFLCLFFILICSNTIILIFIHHNN
jgi:hypothetical protein